MSPYIFPPAPQAAVPVQGSAQQYAVSRIFCVGRNYAAHAREMGFDPDREPPFYFHHEMELVIAIGKPALRVTPETALECVWGYACGLDMTRRDLQFKARDKGRPWDFGKDFDHAAVIGTLAPASVIGHPAKGGIRLTVNGQIKQNADIKDLIWSVPEIVANLSAYYPLRPGDLIYTGTPEGVGPVQPGDVLAGRIEGVGEIALTIGQPL